MAVLQIADSQGNKHTFFYKINICSKKPFQTD